MQDDSIKITGDLTIVVYGPDGAIKDSRDIKNLVVSTGKTLIAQLISGSGTAPSHFGLGTGTVPAAVTDTTLATAGGTRVAFDSSTNTANVTTYIASINPGTNTGSWTEAGIFNASSAGTMLSRTTFNTIIKTSVDKLVITWNIRVN